MKYSILILLLIHLQTWSATFLYPISGGASSYAQVTNALALTGSASTYLRSDGAQANPSAGATMSGTVSNNVAFAGLLSVDGTKTNGIAATSAHVQAALGQVYQATNTTLTTYAGMPTNAILNTIGAQPTNAALTALAGNPNLYQATNASLTAVANNPNLYQSTNSTTTRLAGIGAGTSGDVLFRDGTGWTNLVKSTDNKVLKLSGGFPSWQDDATAVGGETAGTVHAPDGATTANVITKFKDTTGTNITAASSSDIQVTLGQVYHATNSVLKTYEGMATNTIRTVIGAVPNTFAGVTNALNYFPLTNTLAAVTNALGLTGSSSTFLRSDGTQATPGGSGNVVNTGASVVGMVPVYTDASGTAVTPTNTLALSGGLSVGGSGLSIFTNGATFLNATASRVAMFGSAATNITNVVTTGILNGDGSAASSANIQSTLGQVYQATNAALTALAGNPNLYQATNTTLTTYQGMATNTIRTVIGAQPLAAPLTALAADANLYQSTNTTTTRFAGIGTGVSGDVLYRDATGWTNLAKGADNKVLKLISGLPSWQTDETSAGGESSGTVHAPDGATTTGAIAAFKDISGTNITTASSANLQTALGQVYQATNAALTALAGNPNLYQATNANLTALANNANLYQATNTVLTTYQGMATNTILTTIGAVSASSTADFSNKTLDAAGTGNVVKQTKYLMLMRPDYGDGAGAVPQTNTYTASGLMHYTFSGNAETNVNWVVYELTVPPDIDTSVAMTATVGFVSGGIDADTVTFHLTYALGAAGTALPTGTAIATSPIVVTTTPTTPASGDVQQSAATTLTGWAASMTAGSPLFIRMARLQDTNDNGNRDLFLRIAYGSTQ